MPTLTALEQMLQSVGFSEVETVYTPSFRYWKKLIALVDQPPAVRAGDCARARFFGADDGRK